MLDQTELQQRLSPMIAFAQQATASIEAYRRTEALR
jgi:hypothetical protein